MVITSTTATPIPQALLPKDGTQAPTALETPAGATDPAVVVTLSPEAQQVLDSGAPPPTPTAPTLQEQLAKAASILTDKSGAASVDDQLAAFKLIGDSLLNAKGAADPNLQFAGALVDSDFAQHLDQLVTYVRDQGAAFNSSWQDFTTRAGAHDRALAAFESLSADDQKIFVAAKAMDTTWGYRSGTVISTVDDYRANMTAQSDVERALQAALEDPRYADTTKMNGSRENDYDSRVGAMGKLAQASGDQQTAELAGLLNYRNSVEWTQRAQAYFAKYGPAPEGDPSTSTPPDAFVATPTAPRPGTQRVIDAIATMNDTSGSASVDDKLAAMQTTQQGAVGKDVGLGGLVLLRLSWATSFAKEVDAAGSRMMNQLNSVGRYMQSHNDDAAPNGAQLSLDYLNGLSDDEQKLVAKAYGYDSVQSWTAQLSDQSSKFSAAGTGGPNAALALTTLRQVSDSQKQRLEEQRAQRAQDGISDTRAAKPATSDADDKSARAP